MHKHTKNENSWLFFRTAAGFAEIFHISPAPTAGTKSKAYQCNAYIKRKPEVAVETQQTSWKTSSHFGPNR